MTTSGVALFWAIITAILLGVVLFDMFRLWRAKLLIGEARAVGPLLCLPLVFVILVDGAVAGTAGGSTEYVVPATGLGLVVAIAAAAFVAGYHIGVRHELRQRQPRQ